MNQIKYHISNPSFVVFQKSLVFWQSYSHIAAIEHDFDEETNQGEIKIDYTPISLEDPLQYHFKFTKNQKKNTATDIFLNICDDKDMIPSDLSEVFPPIIEWCKDMGINPIAIDRSSYRILWIIAGISLIGLIILGVLRST